MVHLPTGKGTHGSRGVVLKHLEKISRPPLYAVYLDPKHMLRPQAPSWNDLHLQDLPVAQQGACLWRGAELL